MSIKQRIFAMSILTTEKKGTNKQNGAFFVSPTIETFTLALFRHSPRASQLKWSHSKNIPHTCKGAFRLLRRRCEYFRIACNRSEKNCKVDAFAKSAVSFRRVDIPFSQLLLRSRVHTSIVLRVISRCEKCFILPVMVVVRKVSNGEFLRVVSPNGRCVRAGESVRSILDARIYIHLWLLRPAKQFKYYIICL